MAMQKGPGTTRWSLVRQAAGVGADAEEALSELCRRWQPAVAAYLGARLPAQDAEDAAQAFMLHVIESRLAGRADPARGRFRAFVYTSLRHWLVDRARRESAAQRNIPLSPGAEPDHEAHGDAPPDPAFDRAWSAHLLNVAWSRLREEAKARGRLALFEAAAPFVEEAPDAGEYSSAARALGLKPNTFAVAVSRLRGRYRELVTSSASHSSASTTVARTSCLEMALLFAR
jgi:DNA-directed RNA polymerase specialized sigma24 family protein